MIELSLEQQVKNLTELVHKQSKLIAKTGEKVMEIQMNEVKSKMAAIDLKQPKFDPKDFASNEDIAQLIFEVLNQMEYLEDRTIKRVCNSRLLNASKPSEQIAPLYSKDGEEPPEIFPNTVKDLLELKPLDLIQLCDFYDLFVDGPTPEQTELLNAPNICPEEAIKLASMSGGIPAKERLAMSSEDDLRDIFDEFSRYIGVLIRRGTGW